MSSSREITMPCVSCSKRIPIDSNSCPYCGIVLKWVLNGELRADWQQYVLLGPIKLVGPLERMWLKAALVKCEVNWDIIILHMADGSLHEIKRGEYRGTYIHAGSLFSLQRWGLFIKPINGKRIHIETLLVKYPDGKTSIEKLINVLGLEKSKLNTLMRVQNALESFRGLGR